MEKMSSSIDTTPDSTDTSIESSQPSCGLSLFDQLKNSVDHNSVTKTALVTLSREDKTPKTTNDQYQNKDQYQDQHQDQHQDQEKHSNKITETQEIAPNDSNNPELKDSKPEFHAPKLLPPPSSTCAISGLGTVSPTKRANNRSTKLNQKPPPTNIRNFTSLRSLKRSQESTNTVTQETGTPLSSSAAGLLAATSESSSAVTAGLRNSSSSSSSSVATDLAVINHNAKRKRCTDRYDSSESSDSGVATSLSCTDSSTGSSEDASEPGSPFSLHSSLSEDHQLQQLQLLKQSSTLQNNNHNKMSPQTILVASSGTTTATSNQNMSSASVPAVSSSVTLSSSASLNAAIRSSNLPASLTITPTNGGGSSHSNSLGANKAKLPVTQFAKSSITANTNRCSNLPTLQWPWSTTTTTTTSTIPPPSSSSSSTTSPSSISFSTSTTGTNTHLTHTAANNTTSTTNVSNQAKKRVAPHVNVGGSECSSNAKKSRSNVNNTQFQDGHHVTNAAGAKRLKAAALEESQTKITGYFKSQMKAQMHAANNKLAATINSVSSGNMLMNTTSSANANSHSNTMTTNALTMSAPATTASLNKYFNILAQLKENSKAANNVGTNSNAPVATGSPMTPPAPVNLTQTQIGSTGSAAPTISTNLTTPTVTITSSKPQNLTVQPVTMPALKKIERPKPTKIAQVAPNLRKTPSINSSYSNLSNGTGKSPAKKHVAIAPRTPEMKQQQQQNQLVSNKQENIKQSPPSAITASGAQTGASSAQQPAVLLTAIRLNSGQQQTTTPKQSLTNHKLTQAPTVGSTNTGNTVAGSPAPTTVTNAPATATTLYQLPAVQLPNLVQLPHLLAANGANLMQLNNMASMVKTAVSAAAASTSAATSATSAQAAQAAAAQYFLNGTVFKLQQFTTATTTTSTTAATAGNGNPFNLLSASDLQDMLIKQQQQQQQLQQMQQQQKAAVANATATSFQEIFQQQIAAAIAANQQQQQQAQLQQLQRLGAAANIQQQPVFMATPAGLLLNAASLPAMLAQAAAALAVNTQQQQQHQKAMALPALQPIQQTPLPALSSIFAPPAHQQTNEQHELQHLQQQQLAAHLALAHQQFITTSQPPPLSSVSIPANTTANLTHNNNNCANINSNVNISNSLNTQTSLAPAVATQNNTAKLAIVKANAIPAAFTTLSSQPPPLVTISNAKTRAHLNTTTSGTAASQKPSVLSKPYQKRSPKVSHNQAKTSLNVPNPANKTNTGKITTSTGKIIASPTTPPPLVPTLTACVQQPVALTSVPAPGIRAATAASLTKPSSQLPTPALVSIAPTNTTPIAPKPAQSITCGSVTITPTSASSTGKSLVNIAPKVSTAASNNQLYKFNSKTTNINTLPTVSKTKVKSSASDLFDLVKNSNGAISITPTPTTAVAAFNNMNNFSAPLNFSVSTANFKSSMPLENFGKIKDEPMDDIPMVSTISNISTVSTIAATNSPVEDNSEIKHEPPTSFSGQIPTKSPVIKEEVMNPPPEEEESEKSCSPEPNILMNNECSSSSFSCHSNSVSSAADLSLEASTPASITSGSEAPSPGCSMLSPLNTSCNQFAAPNPCLNSNSVGYSNSSNSNSCETAGGASARDMLSEMVTSTCISSDSSEASISVSLPDNEEGKQSMSDVKGIDEIDNEKQRDLPTPESGIGGSLSNTESMDSSSKSSNSETSSSAASSTCEQEVRSPTSDTQTPPATPLAIDSSSSMEETQTESLAQSNSFSEYTTSMTSCDFLTPTIDTKLAELSSAFLPKCAISPILSQPKTIRFPANKGNKRHDGICYWDKCNKKHDSNSKLLDHMQQQHVNSQTGPFACLWVGCKVYNKESCSRRWLERHVLSHGGSKQFKCIVEGCGLRFGSQLALQKHVNNHFSATENKESTNKRTSDPPVPKQLRKNGKKLRYRRQPFSARMFDFFDAGIMEGLQHRLRQISTLTNGCNSITFQGQCIMKRKAIGGKTQCYVQWSPREIISDEWLPESEEPFLKTINIKQMKPTEKNKVESLLMTAYKLPYSPTIFENDYALSRQHQARAKNTNDKEGLVNGTTENSANEEDDDDDNDDDEDEDDTATTSAETISSYQHVLSITNTQMQQHRKHPRKQQSRITVTR